MGRRKAKAEERLDCKVQTQVNRKKFRELEELAAKTAGGSMPKLIRDILYQRAITIRQVDGSLDVLLPELAAIRKELNAIGQNINQLTRFFHAAPEDTRRFFYAAKIAGQYDAAGKKVEVLLGLIRDLAEVWLQK